MSSTRVLVTQQAELLDRALTSMLLGSSTKHELVTSSAKNLDDLMVEISDLMPNVIVLGESTPLAARDTLAPLLMAYPELRVIVISEDTNWLHVFHKKDLLLTHQSDLLDIINFD
jgi:chemotaxis response regulator CheB